jgi:RsiW-degrading membrane proteinase PrsW (M82 family)
MTAPALRSPRELLWQPRNWTYWVYLAAVVVAFFSMLSAFQPLRLLAPPAATTAVGVNIALGVVIGLIIVWLSVIHRPSSTLAVAAVVWGGVVAVAIAFYVNDNLLGALPGILGDRTATDWGAAIAGPSNEEWLKAVGVLAVIGIGIRSVSRPIHGLFLGAWCGLGFQVVEDISYAMNGALTNPTSDAAGLAQILGVRGIVGLLPSHWVFAACSGYGIGYALLRRDRPLAVRVLFALAMFAIAWSMHFLWNSPLITGQLNPMIGMAIKVVVILAAFFVVYRLAMGAEWRWYRHVVSTDPALTRTFAAGVATARGDAARPPDDSGVSPVPGLGTPGSTRRASNSPPAGSRPTTRNVPTPTRRRAPTACTVPTAADGGDHAAREPATVGRPPAVTRCATNRRSLSGRYRPERRDGLYRKCTTM